MNEDEKWAVIAGERRALADLLDGLDAEQWESPSLCSQWRIRDVAAHVALTPRSPGMGEILWRAVKGRGNFDAVNRDMALEIADCPTAELVGQLRELADDRSKPLITTLDNLHFDVMVHVQDVAIPLGLTHEVPLRPAGEAATRVWRMGWPFWAKRRLRGVRLEATDVEWSVGEGEPVRGPIEAMLLLLTGRTAAALPRLEGAGVEVLAGQGSHRT